LADASIVGENEILIAFLASSSIGTAAAVHHSAKRVNTITVEHLIPRYARQTGAKGHVTG